MTTRTGLSTHYASLDRLSADDLRQASALANHPRVQAEIRSFAAAIVARGEIGAITALERDQMRRMVASCWPLVGSSLRPIAQTPTLSESWKLCEIWGMWETGGPLKSAKLLAPGQQEARPVGVDQALHQHGYVEATWGFPMARPALLHVFGHGEPAATTPYRCPGETQLHALARLGWIEFADLPPRQIPAAVVRRFLTALEWRLEQHPLCFPSAHRDDEGDVCRGAESVEYVAAMRARQRRAEAETRRLDVDRRLPTPAGWWRWRIERW